MSTRTSADAGKAAATVSSSEVMDQLSRIVASKGFAEAQRLSRFLRFVVEETLAGRAGELKESVVAREVYDRGSSFDPRVDSIVRAEAVKLRSRLHAYYEQEGLSDPVRIDVPKGSYVPVFEPLERVASVAAKAGDRARYFVTVVVLCVSGIVGAIAWISYPSRPPSVPRLTPLGSDPGHHFRPSLSPDGNYVAFGWTGGSGKQNFDIYIRQIGQPTSVRLTSHPEWEGAPAWSPNGRHIVFVRANLGVFLVPPIGGVEQNVIQNPVFPYLSWTADSESILVAQRGNEREPYAIFAVSIQSGESNRLTKPPQGIYGDTQAAISPDGHQLAFVRANVTTYVDWAADVYVARLPGGEARRLTFDNQAIAGLAWTPDGHEIVFGSRRGGERRIWRVRVADNLRSEPRLVEGAGHQSVYPTLSRTKPARLVYQRAILNSNIYRSETSGGQLKSALLIGSTRSDYYPEYSPDGTRIAFVSQRAGDGDLWVSDSDGGNLVQLTQGLNAGRPRWSPDGSRISFPAMVDGNYDIYEVAESRRPAVRRLMHSTSREANPSWSRDGKWIYFMSDRSGSEQIWRMPAAGGAALQITAGGGFEGLESPDGKLLYYVKSRDLQGLWSVPTSGGNEISTPIPARYSMWSVGAKGIYYADYGVADTSLPSRIKLYSFETSQTTNLGILAKPVARPNAGVNSGLSISWDGRSLLSVSTDQAESELMLVESFR